MPTLPQHIAVIMDGNGRWATARNLTRTEGHKKGAETARQCVEWAKDLHIPYVTLFGFSSENWSRPETEVSDLMNLLRYYLTKEVESLHQAGARISVIGDRQKLPQDVCDRIRHIEDKTKNNEDIHVTIALSYGGRQEIVSCARALGKKIEQGLLTAESITEQVVDECLMTAGMPDPDLIIRTGGEYRVSNFLLWQMAYAELFFTKTLWPDFSKMDLEDAIAFYAGRERRFGGLLKEARG